MFSFSLSSCSTSSGGSWSDNQNNNNKKLSFAPRVNSVFCLAASSTASSCCLGMTVLNCKDPGCQDALSCQKRLIHLLLFCVVLLSLLQVVCLAVFFALVYPLQGKSESLPSHLLTAHFGDAAIESFSADPDGKFIIAWEDENGMPSQNFTLHNGHLQIHHDGLYFLYTQISLQTISPANIYTVEVWRKTGVEEVVLLGRSFNHTGGPFLSSTYTGRQFKLSANDKIYVKCTKHAKINTDSQKTFFGIYMVQQYK
ncbi:tumor necrosis factor ligand superfamily member 18 [Lepisosteus oculatus]|uniref:tumor necrosis factor ligand superfamily member 18 n=1 Tax=Lepisosteus oculatus TaxID=7918 RepID=UPI0007401AD1|nr:PREDICTED: tumor necrosis factor ligand superfamily member 10-like [Lepisosteus oculatus]